MRPAAYRHLFFDLDHTLWDFDTNSRATLEELFVEERLGSVHRVDLAEFLLAFHQTNGRLWDAFHRNELSKDDLRDRRFGEVLAQLGIQDQGLAHRLSDKYLDRCPRRGALMPYTLEVLNALAPHYRLHILTNGFAATQDAKLKGAGLEGRFDLVITAETYGYHKPDRRFFLDTVRKLNAKPKDCLMIGDNLYTDMFGAQQASLDRAYYNPLRRAHTMPVTYELRCLRDLIQHLTPHGQTAK